MTTLIEICTILSNSHKNVFHENLHENIFDSLTRKVDEKLGDVKFFHFNKNQIKLFSHLNFYIYIQDDINKMMKLINFNKQKMDRLINNILDVKWPKNENEETIITFIFNNLHSFKAFYHLSKYLVKTK